MRLLKNAGLIAREVDAQWGICWLPYIEVADCDAATCKATESGANQVIAPPMDIEMIGRFSIVMNPLGAPIGLIKSAAEDRVKHGPGRL